MEKGYIYALVNPSMNGMVKIGKTNRNPQDRANELSANTNMPFPFEVGYEKLVSNVDLAEKIIHKKLEKFRVSDNREFFSLSLREAVNVINKIIIDEKISLTESEVWDYSFQDHKYSDLKELVIAFTNDKNSFDKALIHIEKGYIEKWLENTRNYDYLITLKELREQYGSNIDLVLISLLFSIENIPFKLFGIEINSPKIISLLTKNNKQLNTTEKELFSLFENNKLLEYYTVYKKYQTVVDKKLNQIFDLNSRGYNYEEIVKILDWFQNPNNYYLSSDKAKINLNDIPKIPSKNEIQSYIDDYFLPHEILKKLKSSSISEVMEARKILRGKCVFNEREYNYGIQFSLLKKNSEYQISDILLGIIENLSISEYLKISKEVFTNNEFLKLSEQLLIPKKLLLGLNSYDIETFTFCLNLVKLGTKSSNENGEIEKYLESVKKSTNLTIIDIIQEFEIYKKLYEQYNIFRTKHENRLKDYTTFNVYYLAQGKHGKLNDKEKKLFEDDLFLEIVKEHNTFAGITAHKPYFIWKDRMEYFLSIANKFIVPKPIDISIFIEPDLNKFYWLLIAANENKLIKKSEIENLLIPEKIKNVLKKDHVSNAEFNSLSEILPSITDHDSIKDLIIPDFINKIFESEDEIFFKNRISLFKSYKEKNLFLFKKNIEVLCKTFYFPQYLETELRQSNLNYYSIISYLKVAGIFTFFSYHDIYEEYVTRKEKYNKFKKSHESYSIIDNYSIHVNILHNNRQIPISGFIGGLTINFNTYSKDKKGKELYDLYKATEHLNWTNYASDMGYSCATIKTRYVLQNLDSWLLITDPLTNKKLLIDKNDVDKYRDLWNAEELDLLFKTFNKLVHYHILVQFIIRKVCLSKLIELNKNIDIVKNIIPEKYLIIVKQLENYFNKISEYEHNPHWGSDDYKIREFGISDYKLISEISNILHSKNELINNIFRNRIAKKLLKTINSFKNEIVEVV